MKPYMIFIMLCFISHTFLAPTDLISNDEDIQKSETLNSIKEMANLIDKPFDPVATKNLSEQYIAWSKTLTKKEMIRILIAQQRLYAEFTHREDVINLVDSLKDKPMSAVYDVFMHYQKRFVLPDLNAQTRDTNQRVTDLQQSYQDENNQTSFFRKLPFVHNIEALLLPDITNLTDADLYKKIEAEMKRIGFSQEAVTEELTTLKNESAEMLQAHYPSLQNELAHRLAYLGGVQKDNSTKANIDYYTGLLHTWTTTAASILANATSFIGINPSALQMIASSSLLDPYLGQKQVISKRQMLAMIYAQYKSFDALQDAYLDPHFKEMELLTKNQILTQLKEYMESMGFDTDTINQRLSEYEKLSKVELVTITKELEYLTKNISNSLSAQEKLIATSTRSEMIEQIEELLRNVPEDKKSEFLVSLESENLNYVRFTLLDLLQQPHDQVGVPHASTKENFILHYTPRSIAQGIRDPLINHLKSEWQSQGKSKAYQYWREQDLRKKFAEQEHGLLEPALDLKNRIDLATTFANVAGGGARA